MAVSQCSNDGVSKVELDRHAESPVVGSNAYVLERTGQTVSVSGFTDELGTTSLDVVHAAVVYDCDQTGHSYVLIIYNALHVPSMECSSIYPFIKRFTGIVVDECPKFLANIPSVAHHSIYFPDQDLRVSLALDGIVSYFPCRIPRGEELADHSLFLPLTPPLDKWDPHDVIYKRQEESMTDFRGDVKAVPKKKFLISLRWSRAL